MTATTRFAGAALAAAGSIALLAAPASAAVQQGATAHSVEAVMSAPAETCTMYFNTDAVRIRTQPNTAATVLGLGYSGQQIDVLQRGSWYQIRRHSDGLSGWVYSSYVTTACS